MRSRLKVALIALLSLAAAVPASSAAATAGGFVVTPDIAASSCNGGAGAQLPTHGAGEATVATGVLGDGSILTAFSEIYPGKPDAVIDSVSPDCTANQSFGSDGTATVAIPPQLVPAGKNDNGGFDALWINAISPRLGGGSILAGVYRNRWVIAALTADGQLDSSFGTNGWTALPWRGEASQLLQEPSGRILVGGDNSGGGCCTVNHVGALTADGRLDPTFGTNGRTTLPTGEDAGVASLAREPNGDILAEVYYGNMGCWGVGLAMLTPAGHPVANFAKRLAKFWRGLGFGAFVGDVYVDGGGFTLVGTGQRPCADGPNISANSATGVIAHFRSNGTALTPAKRFASSLYGEIRAFKHGPNALVLEASYGNGTRETLRLLGPNGGSKTSFGSNGKVVVRAPWRGAATEALEAATPRSLLLVATKDGRKQFQVIRLLT